MRLRCDDGLVRRFSTAHTDGEFTRSGRVNESHEAECLECGEQFGVHDLHILKPIFLKHVCSNAKAQT